MTGTQVASPIHRYLERLHARFAELREGAVATYIPELAKADPEWFGICLATVDGCVYEVGDTRQPFTIQSISKPFTYGLAMEDRGRDAVLAKIGVEPTGDAFNSISLAPDTGCPLNPMINAGAIAATSLVAGDSPTDRLERLLSVFSLYAGRRLTIDPAVYESERDTGHRNRAIGHMLRNFDVLTADPEPALDLYFQQCSIAVDCHDLGLMAATLANGGVHPLTRERAVRADLVETILSVMTTCGMYDYAGEWVYWVGMPAKSGVAGGVLAVLPGQLGIAVFSPRLDARGNSVRGVAVCRALSQELNLHFLCVPRAARAAIRARYSVSEVSSKRLRGEHEREVLDAVGQRACVYDLQGDVTFAAVESVVRAIVEASVQLDVAIVPLGRVTRVDPCAAVLFVPLILDLAATGKQLAFVAADHHPRFVRALEEGVSAADAGAPVLSFADLDRALEWAENRLLAAHGPRAVDGKALSLAEHQVCAGLDADAVMRLGRLLERRRFEAGALIVRKGETADALYLLTAGQLSVLVDLPGGRVRRLATLSPGMPFGELAFIDRSVRTADVRADSPVECYVLTAGDFARLADDDPALRIRIVENLLRRVARLVGRLNEEITTLTERD